MHTIIKRDGRLAAYDRDRIEFAVLRCFAELPAPGASVSASRVVDAVENLLARQFEVTGVEVIQDAVENALMLLGEHDAARRYILFRDRKRQLRNERPIPPDVFEAFEQSSTYFPTPLQQFQFFDKYARFNYALGRRETWVETVDRATDYLAELANGRVPGDTLQAIREGILHQRVMPSMRLLAMAGPAARRDNVVLYNCAFVPVDSIDAFVEALLISMAGCGVGFSVEMRHVSRLPRIPATFERVDKPIVVEDSMEGWAAALEYTLEALYEGLIPSFDYSQVRPAGAPLRTKGGRASGPGPLQTLVAFVVGKFLENRGGVLSPLVAHDIMCVIGQAAVSGGVRRTAMLSLFDYDDQEMLTAKDGDLQATPWRWNANNSIVVPGDRQLTQLEVMRLVGGMVEGGRGEPGIFSRRAAAQTLPERRRWDPNFGCNPCGEVLLRPRQFCNLSQAVCREGDSFKDLREKVHLATVIGTIQSTATYFPNLHSRWRENCEEERLLGVDLNGQRDCTLLQLPGVGEQVMEALQTVAVESNQLAAGWLSINPSAAITCVKPNGNSSQLLDSSSGLHPRWARYYRRNVRISAHSPVYKLLQDAGVPLDPENGQEAATADTWVAHFPVAAPEGATLRTSISALEQLSYWLQNKIYWTEHNPSATITYRPSEVLDIATWLYNHQDVVAGVTFLPESNARYEQMPYEEITEDEYHSLVAAFPQVDYAKLIRYEDKDLTTSSMELACMAGGCGEA